MSKSEADILIGVDAGTSLIKCVAFSATGETIATCSTPNEYISTGDSIVEQDMQLTAKHVIDTIRELVNELGSKSANIKAVSITAQGDGLWLVDKAGEPLHNGWLWLDSRSADIASEIENHANYARLFELTGTAINASQNRAQMLWLERHDPDLLDRASACFHCKDYLYFILTGAIAGDQSESLCTFGDFRTGTYSDEVFSLLGLGHRAKLLPPIVDGLEESAPLLAKITDATGLPSGTPVVLGAIDVICSALGGGLFSQSANSALTVLGTTGIHVRYSKDANAVTLPAEKSGYTLAFPGGGFAQLQTNMSATMNIDWLLKLITEACVIAGQTPDEKTMLDYLDQHVMSARPASAIFHPYISTAGERGPFFNADARASFFGLDQNNGLNELARSVFEGICMAARDCYSSLGEFPEEISITGGGANSKSLSTLFATIMNRPVRSVSRDEAGAAGAAMIAAVHHRYYSSVSQCVDQWVAPHFGDRIVPDQKQVELYNDAFNLYQELRNSHSPHWVSFAKLPR